jgi:hypothetical protein
MEPGLSDEEIAAHDALLAETEREAERVGVDWDAAAPALRELILGGHDLPAAHDGADTGTGEVEMELGLDAQALRDVLRTLPDGAGTARFLAAFRERELGQLPPTAETT